LDPLDIADWVQKRELAGDTRTMIAKRLGKPKSYISEIALLIKAPTAIREAFKTRRIPDIRTAYLLSRHHEEDPAATSAWLAGNTPITRLNVTQALVKSGRSAPAHAPKSKPVTPRSSAKAQSWNTFAVQVAGREGRMDLTPGPRANQATVYFADGSRESVALSKIRLKNWTTL
jgi:ParB family chromosome partitioning protein